MLPLSFQMLIWQSILGEHCDLSVCDVKKKKWMSFHCSIAPPGDSAHNDEFDNTARHVPITPACDLRNKASCPDVPLRPAHTDDSKQSWWTHCFLRAIVFNASHLHIDFHCLTNAFDQIFVEWWKQQPNNPTKLALGVTKKFFCDVPPGDYEQHGKIQLNTLHPHFGCTVDPVHFRKVLMLEVAGEDESPPTLEEPNCFPDDNEDMQNLAKRLLKDAKTECLSFADELGNDGQMPCPTQKCMDSFLQNFANSFFQKSNCKFTSSATAVDDVNTAVNKKCASNATVDPTAGREAAATAPVGRPNSPAACQSCQKALETMEKEWHHKERKRKLEKEKKRQRKEKKEKKLELGSGFRGNGAIEWGLGNRQPE